MEERTEPIETETTVPEDAEWRTLDIGPTIRLHLPVRWSALLRYDTSAIEALLAERDERLAGMEAVLEQVGDRDLNAGQIKKLEATRARIEAIDEGIGRGAGLGSVRLDMRLARGRYVVERLEAAAPRGGPLDLEAVRRFKFTRTLQRLLPGILGQGGGSAAALASMFGDGGRDSLERVAYVYRLAELLGQPPTTAVARDLRITPAAAAQRVRRARTATPPLLPPAPTRKAK